MRLPWLTVVVLACLLGSSTPAWAYKAGTYALPLEDRVREVFVGDLDGDGRRDLIVLAEPKDGQAGAADRLWLIRTPATPTARRFVPEAAMTRVVLDGPLADAGALAVGAFGPDGATRLRFLTPKGVVEMDADGQTRVLPPARAPATLLGRSPGQRVVAWDGVADLDGDGLDELWYPEAAHNGRLRVVGGTLAQDARLALTATNQATQDGVHGLTRHAFLTRLEAHDLDGDGARELIALRDGGLVAWSLGGTDEGVRTPTWQMALPFLAPPKDLPPEGMHTPRLQIEDLDGDGVADLLVTLITGRRDKLRSLRTTLVHFPGPFRQADGGLVPPRARLDTEAVALHPTFVDLDGDGAKDYVGNSIRPGGSILEMLPRLVGGDPKIHHVGFRFLAGKGTFHGAPWFTIERTYPNGETMGNTFGRNASFAGDFDGDGLRDLLDLGNLGSVGLWKGEREADGRLRFTTPLIRNIPVPEPLQAAIRVADLDGNGRDDAVLWSERKIYILLSGGGS